MLNMNNLIKLVLTVTLFFPFTVTSEPTEEQKMLLESLPPDQREAIRSKMEQGNKIEKDLEEVFEEGRNLTERPENLDDIKSDCEVCIYGYDIFRFSPTTFAPFDQVPVSPDYLLGPGDRIKISIYGAEQINFEVLLTFASGHYMA